MTAKKTSIPTVTATPKPPAVPVSPTATKDDVAAVDQKVAAVKGTVDAAFDSTGTVKTTALPAVYFQGFKLGPVVEGIQTYIPDADFAANLPAVNFEGYKLGQVVDGVQQYIADSTEFVAMLTRIGVQFGGAPVVLGKAQLLIGGDSHDDGYLTSLGLQTAWSNRMYSSLDSTKFGAPVIIAVAGETLLQQLNRLTNQLLPAIDTINYKQAIIVMGGGANDISTGGNAADIKTRRLEYIKRIRDWQAAHNNFPIKIVVLSVTRNGKQDQGVTEAAYWQEASTANADWIANYKTYGADYYINYSGDIRFIDYTNQAYFNIDRQHFNDNGHLAKAGYNKPTILAAYDGTLLAPVADYVANVDTGGGGGSNPPTDGGGGGSNPPASGTVIKYSGDYQQVTGDFRDTAVLGESLLFSNSLDAVGKLAFTGTGLTLTHAHYGQYGYFAKYDVYVDDTKDGSVDLTNYTGSAAPAVRYTTKNYAQGAHILTLVATSTAYPAFLPLALATISTTGSTTTPTPTPDPTPTPTPTLALTTSKTYADFTKIGDNWRDATIPPRTLWFSDSPGVSATATWTGKQIKLLHGDYSGNGFRAYYDVYIDGKLDGTVDMRAGGANEYIERFASKVYSEGDHTIMLVSLGTFLPIDTMQQFS
jgi:hypothetical protein